MGADRRERVGRAGEEAACRRYRALGYRIVARNWRCALGEIDLVAERRGTLVLCEVKTRSGGAFGGPFEAVTASKRRRLRALAAAFLEASRGESGGGWLDVRFDVASVTLDPGDAPRVHVFEDAF